MAWHVENESRHRPPALPEKQRKLGDVTVEWIPAKPGEAAIVCEGGTIDDRWLAEVITREELFACGIRQARFSFDQPGLPNLWERKGTDSTYNSEFDRRPFFYNPDDHTIYMGNHGDSHGDIHDELGHPGYDFQKYHYGALMHENGQPSGVVSYATAEKALTPAWDSVQERLGFKPEIEDEDDTLWHDAHIDLSKTSNWDDIMAKAKRLIQSGNVTLLRNGYNNIVAHVIGDHGEYQSEISRDDPASRAITQWTCECPWDQYAFQRTRKWKKYEARPCAHVLAAYWKSQGTPLDEDAPPGASPNGGPTPFPQQGEAPLSPFVPQMPAEGPEQGLQPGPDGGAMPGLPPAAQMEGPPQLGPPSPLPPVGNPPMQPDALNPAFMPPAQTGLIPPYPLEPAPQPVSVPGARPGPYPANPLQQPGTLSHMLPEEYEVRPPNSDEKVFNWDGRVSTPSEHKLSRPFEFLNAYHQGQPVGTSMFRMEKDAFNNPYVNWESVYVHPDHRGRGVFRRLWEAMPDERVTSGSWKNKRLQDWTIQQNQRMASLEDSQTLSHVFIPRVSAAEFVPDSRARLNEATLGTSVGREGATDAGQWMEIPEGANVEVVHQDPTTGWVEIRYPLKGGAMTSYHVECFVEPEKLAPLEGDSPMAPRRRL